MSQCNDHLGVRIKHEASKTHRDETNTGRPGFRPAIDSVFVAWKKPSNRESSPKAGAELGCHGERWQVTLNANSIRPMAWIKHSRQSSELGDLEERPARLIGTSLCTVAFMSSAVSHIVVRTTRSRARIRVMSLIRVLGPIATRSLPLIAFESLRNLRCDSNLHRELNQPADRSQVHCLEVMSIADLQSASVAWSGDHRDTRQSAAPSPRKRQFSAWHPPGRAGNRGPFS